MSQFRIGSFGRSLAAIGVVLVALFFLLLGSRRGEALVVLRKAVQVCLECIGIG